MSDQTLRALILDFDGTIADTIPICIEAYQDTLEEHGRPRPSAAEVVALFGPAEEGMLQQEFGTDLWRDAHATFLGHYERLHAGVSTPFEGAVDLFEELMQKQVKLGIVTGKGAGSLKVSLRVLGLDRFFPERTWEAGSPKGAVKRDCLDRLLARLELDPGCTAYIGDMPSDVRVAREVGMRALAARWASNVEHDALLASEPDEDFSTYAELTEWVRQQPIA